MRYVPDTKALIYLLDNRLAQTSGASPACAANRLHSSLRNTRKAIKWPRFGTIGECDFS